MTEKRKGKTYATGRKVHKSMTDDDKERFLKLYAHHGRKGYCATQVGVTMTTVIQEEKRDEDFKEGVAGALHMFRERIEGEITRRAIDGWEDPVYQKGEEVGVVRRYSDRLMELLAKRHIPEYTQRLDVDMTAKGGILVVPGIVGQTNKNHISEEDAEAAWENNNAP